QTIYQNAEKPKKQIVTVLNEIAGLSTKFTITGNTSTHDLNNIVKLAKDYGVELSFTNEKYHRNQLEYVELNYFSNNKWETLTFGTDELKLLPIYFSLEKKYDKVNGDKSFLIIYKNRNDQLQGEPKN